MLNEICNNFLHLAKKRKSTYDFSNKMVSGSDIIKILEAGQWAASSHNSQPWKFIVIKNKKTIDELMKLCTYGGFYTAPPVIIAVVLEPMYLNKKALLHESLEKFTQTHKYMNVAFAASNIVHEAESLSIDSCVLSPWIHGANKILGVPKTSETVLLIGIGYAAKGAYYPPRSRLPLNEIISYEKYDKVNKK